jgi:hypothetical protein
MWGLQHQALQVDQVVVVQVVVQLRMLFLAHQIQVAVVAVVVVNPEEVMHQLEEMVVPVLSLFLIK